MTQAFFIFMSKTLLLLKNLYRATLILISHNVNGTAVIKTILFKMTSKHPCIFFMYFNPSSYQVC